MNKQDNIERADKLERLYNKYRYVMQREAYNILFDYTEAEDAVQQAFVKISKCIDRVKEEEPAMVCNFLKVVTRNVAKDIYKKKLHLSSIEDIADTADDYKTHNVTSVASIVISNDNSERIIKAIMSLPEIYRDVLLIEKIHGIPREESMKILNANYETLKKRLTRAKTQLLEVLKKEELNDGRESIRRNSRQLD